MHITLHLLGWIAHYDELDPTGKCPRECQDWLVVITKVLAGRQNKLSSDSLFHSIIDAMETVLDSFDERLIISNRLDQNSEWPHISK